MFIVDAFADGPLTGNPAAVCPLDRWLPDPLMQQIADEMSLSETVFFVPEGEGFRIRWFTPTKEVDLVGHATLAAGHIVLERIRPTAAEVHFSSLGGPLSVARAGDRLAMDMPALVPASTQSPPGLAAMLGIEPVATLTAKHHLFVFERAADISRLKPDLAAVARLPLPALIVTAPADHGSDHDFVSRFFAPANGVPEDPVAGVAHCCLSPYWSARLGRSSLVGRQLSRRGGTVACTLRGERVILGGRAVTVLEGRMTV